MSSCKFNFQKPKQGALSTDTLNLQWCPREPQSERHGLLRATASHATLVIGRWHNCGTVGRDISSERINVSAFDIPKVPRTKGLVGAVAGYLDGSQGLIENLQFIDPFNTASWRVRSIP